MRETDEPRITWEADLPLFSRRMLSQWSLMIVVTAGIMAGLLAVIFAAQGEWASLLPMAGMVGAACLGLWLLGLGIMAVLFRGRYRVRYTVSGRGITCEQLERVSRVSNRLAIVAGAAAGRANLAGAGLIAASRELEEIRWRGAFRAVFDPAHARIILRNAWRTLMWVQCTPGNYSLVAAAVDMQMQHQRTAERAGRSPLASYLWRTLLAVVASLPLFPLADEFGTSLFVPIVVLCFALATVWMINLFGWVVLAGLLVQAAWLVARLLESRSSIWRQGGSYRAYEVLDSGDVTLLFLSACGCAALMWLSIRALRGRWLAALIQGADDMGA